MLTSRQELKIISLLENSAIIRRDIEEERNDEFLVPSFRRLVGHDDLMSPSEGNASDVIFDYSRKMRLVDDRQDPIRSLESIRDESGVLDDKDLILITGERRQY